MGLFRKFFLSILFLLFASTGFSQTTFKLSGKVLAEDFGPLYNAGVYVSGFSSGVVTDSTGQFQLAVKEGWNEISFSYSGYKPSAIKIFMQHDTLVEVQMRSDLQLAEVIIVDKKKLRAADHDDAGTITLRKENFVSLPALMGENDPMRAVQMQPGVQSGNEGARGIFVRGGSPDQNLILLDGAPVYNPSHVYGFLSVFNSDALDKIEVNKDKYPAQFGGRLCSVMDITADAGNDNNIRGSFSLGILTSRIHVEGPLDKKHKTTFSFSGRVCYAGLFIGPISQHQFKQSGYNGNIQYYFGDVNLKVAHRFSEKDRLELNYFSNNDFYYFRKLNNSSAPGYQVNSNYLQTVTWANYASSLVWTHGFNEKWQTRSSVSFSEYRIVSSLSDHYEEKGMYYYQSLNDSKAESFIRDISCKSDTRFIAGKIQTLKMGAGITVLMFETGKGNQSTVNSYYGNSSSTFENSGVNPLQAYAYLEDEVKPSWHWLINGGFHTRTYTVQGKTFFSFLPRLNMVYTPVKNFSLRSSLAGLTQDMHLLTTSTATSNVLNDYWVPAVAGVAPESSWNFSAGATQKLPLNFEWSVDAFYRIMNNQVEYKEGAKYSSFTIPWYQEVVSGGQGRAYGLEVYVARSYGRVTGSVAYTLGWSQRKFASLNDGNYYPYEYDRRHNVAMQLNYIIDRHFELGASWVYGSGNMVTLPLQSYNSWVAVFYRDYNVQNGYHQSQSGEQITVYTGKNGYRLPAYHHLDLSFTYKKRVKKLEHQFNLSVYNVYNHFNIFEIYSDYRVAPDGTRTVVFKQLSLFPVLPSVSYIIKFGLV